jgi:hypothetical protein
MAEANPQINAATTDGATARPGPAKTKRSAERTAPETGAAQKFTVSHFRPEDFKTGGLRTYVQYRDLGIAEATDGMVLAHVLRFTEPCDPAVVSKEHLHDVRFQMNYVLKGWITSEFEGHGTHTMKAGDAWIQPPRIRHKVLDYSEDCELLEVVMPADFATVELE